MHDLSRRELAALAPLVAVMIWMGVYPKPFLERMEPSVTQLVEQVQTSRARAARLSQATERETQAEHVAAAQR